jgi:hypothetical protein
MSRHPRYGRMVDEASEHNRHGRPGRTVTNPDEQAAMKRAAQLACRGLTISAIARHLGAEGHKNRKGETGPKAWHHQAVRRMLAAMGVNWKRRERRPVVELDPRPQNVTLADVETPTPVISLGEVLAKNGRSPGVGV